MRRREAAPYRDSANDDEALRTVDGHRNDTAARSPATEAARLTFGATISSGPWFAPRPQESKLRGEMLFAGPPYSRVCQAVHEFPVPSTCPDLQCLRTVRDGVGPKESRRNREFGRLERARRPSLFRRAGVASRIGYRRTAKVST